MTMTPEDIQSQQFHVRFRGFDVEEVDSFLERVAEEFLMLKEEKRQLVEQVETLQKEIESYHSKEKAFQHAIMSAQQISDEMKAKSKREAEQTAAAARQEAKQIREEANAEIAKLEGEVDRLREMKGQIQEDLRRTLHTYLQGLEEGSRPAPAQAASPPEQPEPAENRQAEAAPSEEEETPVVDLSDLYEKVDLPDEEIEASVNAQPEGISEEDDVRELFKMDLDSEDEDDEEDYEEEDSSIPDLDEEMLFTLEDPLDEEEGPTLSMEEDEEDEDAEYEEERKK